jgi:tRNA modification GTPase
VVAPTPGTTRDVVTTRIAIAGWPVDLADTAGWHDAANALEQEGIGLAQKAAEQADLCLWVLDASTDPVWPAASLGNVHFVINKTDLDAAWNIRQAAGGIRVSARTGAGSQELVAALGQWLVPDPPPAGAAVPFTDVLCHRVEEAQRLWREGKRQDASCFLFALGEQRR